VPDAFYPSTNAQEQAMQDTGKKTPKDGVEGEGSYSGTRDYNQRTAEFIKKGKVDKAAQDAKRALESGEADLLKAAEEKGKAGDPRGMGQGEGITSKNASGILEAFSFGPRASLGARCPIDSAAARGRSGHQHGLADLTGDFGDTCGFRRSGRRRRPARPRCIHRSG
jgi:hypothetical protein